MATSILNLRDNVLELYRIPDLTTGEYREQSTLAAGDVLSLSLGGGVSFKVTVADLLP